jgi:ubiquitin carboxyl-terminal hydrolase 4/11/15
LDLSEFVIQPEAKAFKYDLYAVSEHAGSLGGGHYTAKAKNPRNGVWYSFNDSYACETTAAEAITSQAYVLFYLRREDETLTFDRN